MPVNERINVVIVRLQLGTGQHLLCHVAIALSPKLPDQEIVREPAYMLKIDHGQAA